MSESNGGSGASATPGRYFDTSPFWAAAGNGRLLVQYSTSTGARQLYPRPIDIRTGRRDLDWREVRGTGTLVSWTVAPLGQSDAAAPARITALVDLHEGVRLLTSLVDTDPRLLGVGLPLELAWVRLEDGRSWPSFRPAA
jgi:uncharacterized protein